MITTPHPSHHEPNVQSTRPSTRRLVRSGALAGAIAAVCTTVVAAIARAADVSLDINATAIPIPAFAWWTIIGAALGVVLARLLRERRRFVVVTTVAAGLSLIPAIAAPDDTATKAVLVGTHLLAAAIIIPTLSQRLTAVNNDCSQGAENRDREAAECPDPHHLRRHERDPATGHRQGDIWPTYRVILGCRGRPRRIGGLRDRMDRRLLRRGAVVQQGGNQRAEQEQHAAAQEHGHRSGVQPGPVEPDGAGNEQRRGDDVRHRHDPPAGIEAPAHTSEPAEIFGRPVRVS